MVQAIWNGKVIAQSENTIEIEGNQYFPKNDVKKEFLKKKRSSHNVSMERRSLIL